MGAMRICSVIFVMCLAGGAFADTVPTKGGDVTVLGLRAGMVEVADGRQVVTRVMPGVEGVIVLTAYPKVAEAEQAFLERQYKKAISLYGEGLKDIEGPGLGDLVRLRMARALDADGQLVEATRVFLGVYASQPVGAVAGMRPVNLPLGGSKALGQAAGLVEAAIAGKGLTAAQVRPLKLYLLDLYLKAEDERSAALAHELSGAAATVAAASAADAEAAAGMLAKAAALEGQKQFDEACMAYLTVAAEYPNTEAAPAALLAAAKLQAGVRKQPEEAARLAKKIVESYPNSAEALAAKKMVP